MPAWSRRRPKVRLNSRVPGRDRKLRIVLIALVWAVLLAAVVGGVLVIGRNAEQVLGALAGVTPAIVILVLILASSNYLARFVRWHGYLRQLGSRVPVGADAVAYVAGFAFTATPAKAGEAGRALLLKRYAVPYSRTLGVCVVERVLDLVSVLLLALVGLSYFSDYQWIIWLAGGLLAVAGMFLGNHRLLDALLSALEGLGWRLLSRAVAAARKILVEIRALLGVRILSAGVFVGLLGWLAEATGFWLLAAAMGFPLEWNLMVGIYAVSLLAGAISFLPGGVVGTEIVMMALLHAQGVPVASALALTLSLRTLTLGYSIALGALALLGSRLVFAKTAYPE